MTPIIFVHGFKGARLLDADGRTDWLCGSTALGLRTPALTLPLCYGEGGQATDGRSAAGPLEKVVLIPKLLEQPVYGPWLAMLQRLGRPWYAFAYDWRRDNLESAARLAEFVDRVRQKHGGQPVHLVAHSNGGLVTLAALHDGLRGVGRVLFAGVPFAGGVGFLDDMHRGTAMGLNRRVLSPAVLATFPSVYSFFPLQGAALTDAAGESLGVDLFEPRDWKNFGLGIYRDLAAVPPEFDAFLAHTLAQAKCFRERLLQRLAHYPPIDVLVGVGRPTLSAIARKPGPRGLTWDVLGGKRTDGDGRVCAAHALPPEGIPYTRYETTREHADVLADPVVEGLLSEKANEQNVGSK